MTITEETTVATTSQLGDTLTQSQRLASAMQRAFQQRKKPGPLGGGSGPLGGGSGPPGGGSGPPGGGSGPPGGGSGPLGGRQPQNAQQPVPPAPDVKAMGSLPQIFNGD